MRIELLESRKRVSRPVWQGAISGGCHLGLIVAVLQATAGAIPAQPTTLPETTLVYVPPPIRSSAPVGSESHSTNPTAGFPAAPDLPPVVAPGSLPANDPGGPSFNAGRKLPDAGRMFSTILPASSDSIPGPFDLEHVDEPVVLLHQPDLRYPAGLERLGLTGRVMVQFVVDTLGRVEASSWDPLEATHPGFERAAFEALMNARFRPARLGGRLVRQLVRQSIRFDVR
jgi:TonB family protein